MNHTQLVGEGDFRFAVADDWAELPDGLDHVEVADVAVDASDRVYAFNRGEHPVTVFDRDGKFLHSLGEGRFTSPHGITVAPDGTVFCTDNHAHFVRKFSNDGQELMTLGSPGQASDTGYVTGQYQSVKYAGEPFNRPTGTAVTTTGDIYVADGYGNARVHCFSPTGDLRFSWGEVGTGPGQFRLVHSLSLMPDGTGLVVIDRENSRLQFFDLDGGFIDQWTDVARPDSVGFDVDGNLYVVELGLRVSRAFCCDGIQMPPLTDESPPSRVSIFSPTGTLLCRWGSDEVPCPAGYFYAAHGVNVDSRGDVYVAQVSYRASILSGAEVPVSCHSLQKFVRVR